MKTQTNSFVISTMSNEKEVKREVDTLYVDINKRLQLAIDADENNNVQIRVYPITDECYWDHPYDTLQVDITEIEQLEKELGQ